MSFWLIEYYNNSLYAENGARIMVFALDMDGVKGEMYTMTEKYLKAEAGYIRQNNLQFHHFWVLYMPCAPGPMHTDTITENRRSFITFFIALKLWTSTGAYL